MEDKKEHEFCLRCGRRLKNPDARQIGYGKVCLGKIRVLDSPKLFETNKDKVQK